jgi:hypothetical protein
VVASDYVARIGGSVYTNQWHDALCSIDYRVSDTVVAGQAPATNIEFYVNANNAAPTNPMVISGPFNNVRIGNTGADNTRRLQVRGSDAGIAPMRIDNTATGATAHVLRLHGGDNAVIGSQFLQFTRPDNTVIGSVAQNAAATVIYNVTSDARLKENIVPAPAGALDAIKALRVRRFAFKGDSTRAFTGLIAQELEAVLPGLVTVGSGKDCDCAMLEGVHDADCGACHPWAVDYVGMIPLLVQAIQELSDAR